jgi:hypothetical protein
MKKILAIDLVVILSMAFSALGAEKKYKVGYSRISWTIPWMVYYRQLFEQEMRKYPNYEVIMHDAKYRSMTSRPWRTASKGLSPRMWI